MTELLETLRSVATCSDKPKCQQADEPWMDVHFNRLSCLQPISPGFKHSTELVMTKAWGSMPSQCGAACAWAQRHPKCFCSVPERLLGRYSEG